MKLRNLETLNHLEMNITKLETWLLKKIFNRIVTQGPHHEENIKQVYGMMREAWEKEFYETNAPTMDAFLFECFDSTQRNL